MRKGRVFCAWRPEGPSSGYLVGSCSPFERIPAGRLDGVSDLTAVPLHAKGPSARDCGEGVEGRGGVL